MRRNSNGLIIKDQKIVQDSWHRLTDISADTELPAGDIIIPFAAWLADKTRWSAHSGRVAVCAGGDDDLDTLGGVAWQFALIALVFPVFTDGRAYSMARLLRERYHFKGELRAVGNVLRDQLFFMGRCGINAFCLSEDKDIEDALNAFTELSVKYQATATGEQPLYRYR